MSTENTTNATKHYESKKVDPRNILVMDGFNVREDFGDLEALMESIVENGLKVPLIAKKVSGEDKWELVDGERRLRAVMMAIERGHDIKYVRVDPFQGSNEQRLLAMAITGMDQKQFSKLEQSEIVRRLVVAEYSIEEIAKKLGKSLPTIYELHTLSQAPKSVKNEINEGTISARTVVKVMKANPSNEQAVIDTVSKSVEVAKTLVSQGQKPKKVTSSNVPSLKVQTTDEKLVELIKHLKDSGIENGRTEFLRSLIINLKTMPVEKLVIFFE